MINWKAKKVDLSHINNLDDLDAEIIKVKHRIKAHKVVIGENLNQIPNELIKASLGSVIPFFKKSKIADETFNTIQVLVGGIVASIIAGKNNNGGFKKGFAETIRQVSLLGSLKTIINLFSKKKNQKPADKSKVC